MVLVRRTMDDLPNSLNFFPAKLSHYTVQSKAVGINLGKKSIKFLITYLISIIPNGNRIIIIVL